jgi:hypothetical protein
MDLRDQIKSLLAGILLPALLVYLAIPYLTGEDTMSPRRGGPLTKAEAFGWGLLFLGSALCIHAWGLRTYDDYPLIRYIQWFLGGVAIVLGILWGRV